MCAELVSLAQCALADENNERIVSIQAGQAIDRQRFCDEVASHAATFRQQSQARYALYCESSYSFAVMLFGLLHAGKQVWIPGNNRPATADKLLDQGCRLLGEWPGETGKISEVSTVNKSCPMRPLALPQTQLTIFTSGSSGQPKAIPKTLLQLQREVEVLERQWGAMLGQAAAVATVSHQHIYGLLFRLLWPLAAGRCFHSQMFLSPEPMLKAVAATQAYWVASPAQLKRLDERTAWNEVARLSAVFSSGGALMAEAARQIEKLSGKPVIEIYGSSETGGIGWRQSTAGARWNPFAGIRLISDQEGRAQLNSPFLPDAESYRLDDRIELHDDGLFTLSGRIDRIVKVEEKRLALDELERVLRQSDQVAQAHTLLLTGRRDLIAAVIVLTGAGKISLQQQGRAAMVRELRAQLMHTFESVVLPRKWLFMDALPLSSQGKIDNRLLQQLLMLDSGKFPQLLSCQLENNRVKLELRIQPELVYFTGHFPEQPILPGVTQLAWTEEYGKLFFAIEQPFLTMEVIKFKKIIQPEALITMTLEWKADSGKLYFDLSSVTESHSSGRMVYGARS